MMKRPWSEWRHEPFWGHFQMQRANAEARNIGWNLTYPQWLKVWEDSGHLRRRGRMLDQYCMARYGDEGIYEIGNVRIITNQENHSERKPVLHTQEFKDALSQRNLGNTYGRFSSGFSGHHHTKEAKARISAKVRTGITKTCDTCGKSFYVPRHRVSAKFCSRACFRHTDEFKENLSRRAAGNQYALGNKGALGLKHNTESRKAQSDALRRLWKSPEYMGKMRERDRKRHENPSGVTKICGYCGEEFYVMPARAESALFCSKACMTKKLRS